MYVEFLDSLEHRPADLLRRLVGVDHMTRLSTVAVALRGCNIHEYSATDHVFNVARELNSIISINSRLYMRFFLPSFL
jgi:hypothetical protein